MPTLRQQGSQPPFVIDYGQAVEHAIQTLETTIREQPALATHGPARWLAIKLLERDSELCFRLLAVEGGPALLAQAQQRYAQLQEHDGAEVDLLIADRRYTWIHHLVGQVVRRPQLEATLTDKIDRVVTHRLLGAPIFLAVMWVVFKVTADVSAPFLDWIDGVISGPLTRWATALIGAMGLRGLWVEGLVVDGIIAGVGGVLVFIPVLMSLYISLSILEESGYMARAAFVMDHLMARIGLQGKSFLPMLVGFGCTVPAIYATRTLENEKDRILTGLLTPFMSCGARLPVYVLFATVFFPEYAGVVIFGIYLLGIVVAMTLGLVLRHTLFKNKEQTALLMELPPYHRPHWRTVWSHTWERTASFLQNAWSLILVTSLVLWLLMAIPTGAQAWRSGLPLGEDGRSAFAHTAVDQSLFATVAGALSPLLAPLGFGSWEASGALLSGFVAKEVVVSTIAQSYGLAAEPAPGTPLTFGADVREIVSTFGQALVNTAQTLPLIVGIDLRGTTDDAVASDLRQAIYAGFEASSGGHAALAGLAFMVFVLIYTPCMVAVAAEKQELGVKWMWYSVIGQVLLAWLLALVVFQGGLWLGWG